MLESIYYNPKHVAGFSSVNKLKEATPGITKKKIEEWLQNQDTYTLHKRVRKRFKRNKYHVTNIDDLFEADLVDLKSLSDFNKGFKYILTVIDVFSKYAWVRTLKSKTSKEIALALDDIFRTSNRIPAYFQTDKGGEFCGVPTTRVLKKYKIKQIYAENPDIKASVIERFNRTLKEKMFRYFTYKDKYEYIDILQTIVNTYNNTKHSTIKMAPKDVNDKNILNVYNNSSKNLKKNINRKNKFNINDFVRISKYKGVFEKGYESNWTTEIFKIKKVLNRNPYTVYKLSDLQNEPIDSIFYEPELQKVVYADNTYFKIDKIIKKRVKNGIREIYVKWRGYPSKFNSWVPESNIN